MSQDASRVGFMTLAPDTRNQIYDMIHWYHRRAAGAIVVCAEKSYRDVPSSISRTCRQIRSETLPYFLGTSHLTFVVRDSSDLAACREWMSFIPDDAWSSVRGLSFKHTHTSQDPRLAPCSLQFVLSLDDASPVAYTRSLKPDCDICFSSRLIQDGTPMIGSILGEMHSKGAFTPAGVGLVLDILETAVDHMSDPADDMDLDWLLR